MKISWSGIREFHEGDGVPLCPGRQFDLLPAGAQHHLHADPTIAVLVYARVGQAGQGDRLSGDQHRCRENHDPDKPFQILSHLLHLLRSEVHVNKVGEAAGSSKEGRPEI